MVYHFLSYAHVLDAIRSADLEDELYLSILGVIEYSYVYLGPQPQVVVRS